MRVSLILNIACKINYKYSNRDIWSRKCSFLNKENVGKLLDIMGGGRAYTILEATANLPMLSLWRGPLWDFIMKNDNGVFSLSKEMPIILFFIFCVLFHSQNKKVIRLVRNNGPWNYGNIRQAIFVFVLEVSDAAHPPPL